MDNQARIAGDKVGLAMFKPDGSSVWAPENWRSWPYVGISSDLGSDANAGYYALERLFELNCDQYNDVSHGLTRDLDLALKGAELWSFALCLVISMNLPHGPHKNDERRHQIRNTMSHFYESHETPRKVPLFLAYAPGIVDGLKRMGDSMANEGDLEQEAWQCMQRRSFGTPEGRRINLCRFMGFIHGLQQHVPAWYVNLFERLTVAIEYDMLSNKALTDKLMVQPGEAEEVGEKVGSTSGAKVAMGERVVKSCAQNAVVISVLTLQDEGNLRLAEIILAGGIKLMNFHEDQNKRNRSAEGCRAPGRVGVKLMADIGS